jgi:hypothetical protein
MKLTKRLTLAAGSLAVAGAALLVSASAGQATTHHPALGSPVVPPELKVPAGNKPVAVLGAKGVQTYTCTDGAWKFLEPAATLWNKHDAWKKTVALHSRGPVWVSTVDGSAVNATVVASLARKGAVPELLLKASATRGDGVFGKVSYVQRLQTEGGLAPTGTCTGTAQIGVPYSATYMFYAPTQ